MPEYYRDDETSVFFGNGAPTLFSPVPALYVNRETGTVYQTTGGNTNWSVITEGAERPAQLFVESTGNDSTGSRGTGRPYLTLAAAMADALAGDTIKIGVGEFAGYFESIGDWKDGLTIEGSGVGLVNDAQTTITGGTVLTSSLGANAFDGETTLKGITIRNLSIDVGDVRYPGTEPDGLSIVGSTTYPIRDLVVENVTVLCKKTTPTTSHGFATGGVDGLQMVNCRGYRGVYGGAFKHINGAVTNFAGINNASAGIISTASETAADIGNPNYNNTFSNLTFVGIATTTGFVLGDGSHDTTVSNMTQNGGAAVIGLSLGASTRQDQARNTFTGITASNVLSGLVTSDASADADTIRDTYLSNCAFFGTGTGVSGGTGYTPVNGQIHLSDCLAANFETGFGFGTTSTGRFRGLFSRANLYGYNFINGTTYLESPPLGTGNGTFNVGAGMVVVLPQIYRLRSWAAYLENSVTETSLITSTEYDGSRIISAALGTRTINVTAGGGVNTFDGSASITIRLKIGTVALCENTVTPAADGRWAANWTVQIRDNLADASAPMHSTGILGAGAVFNASGSAGATVDWTGNDAARTIDVTGQWSAADADNELYMDSMTIELPAWSLAQLP